MSDLEARIKDAISWKQLPWGGRADKFVQLDANATHAVWGHIAPLIDAAIADAKAEALREASNDWWLEADPGRKFEAWQWLKARADNLATA